MICNVFRFHSSTHTHIIHKVCSMLIIVDLYSFITMMRTLLRRTATFNANVRASVPEYRPEANEEKFKSWWSRLNNLSSRPASKVYLAQLSNLLAYYNRQVKDTTQVHHTQCSPLILPPGKVKSSPRDSSTACRKTTKTSHPRSTTSTRSSMTSSPRIPRPSTKSYTIL